jgi:membrane-bound serine protease (ClpP class)
MTGETLFAKMSKTRAAQTCSSCGDRFFLFSLFLFCILACASLIAAEEPSLNAQLKEHIHFDPKGPNTIGLITIGDHSSEINQSTWLYVKNALDHYKKTKPVFVILELNTPGGEVFSAQKISDALKEMDTQYDIPIIAFINNWAISAGAMLAYSCRFITIVKDASMGAAEPLTVSEGKMETASEKVNSAIRADFANRANFFGRNPYIAEAMVDKDVILVEREGKILKVEGENQIRTNGANPDILIKPKGKLLTLTAAQMMEYGVANLLLPPTKLELISSQEQEAGKWAASKMLLFTYPFFAEIPNAEVDAYTMDWKTKFFAFLASPAVSSLIFLGMIIGFYIEVNTPGFGIAGTIALTCLFLIILSSFSLEIANWLELILLLTGMVIILVELFVLPTFGLLGFIGIVLFFAGLFGMMLPGVGSVSFEFDTKTVNAAGEVFFERLAWLCGTVVVAFLIVLLLMRYVTPSLRGMRRFVLAGNEQTGFIAGENPADLPPPGSIGEAFSTLRPSGKIVIDDKLYEAVSYGTFIEKGSKIVVERFEGSTIIVNKVD